MRILIFLWMLIALGLNASIGQLTDDFSDGDIANNPTWSGETALWQVNAQGELQTNGQAQSDEIHLTSPQNLVANTEWTGTIRYTSGGPSTSNRIRIYLTADQQDLESDITGYFLLLGESGSNDAVELYRQDGATDTLLIRGTDGTIGSRIDLLYRVRRDGSGNWQLDIDTDKNGVWELQGNAFDDKYANSSWFGLWVKHSSTRNADFFFDDFYVGPPMVDSEAPSAVSVSVVDFTNITVELSEPLATAPASDVSNFSLLPGNIIPATASPTGPGRSNIINLSFATPFTQNTAYKIVISNQEDTLGNIASDPDTLDFFFFIPDEPQAGDVIIHEIMADPFPAVGLPEVEYVELFNRSTKTFSTEDWTFTNGTVTTQLPAFTFEPGTYLLLVAQGAETSFESFGDVLGLLPWTSLVNSGDNLGLRDLSGELLDSLDYDADWYRDENKEDGGWSLEMIDANNRNCAPIANWAASANTQGGTPGQSNSLAGLVDTDAPMLLTTTLVSPDTILLCFDEGLDAAFASDPGNFSLGTSVSIQTAIPVMPDFECVELVLSAPLPEGQIIQVTASRMADCRGNVMQSSAIDSVLRSPLPQEGDLIINEIFPDFAPQVGLPEAEFVEIFNRSDKAFDLNNWSLSDGRSAGTLPPFILLPNEYLILCPEDAKDLYTSFGNVLEISGFPGLNNAGDSVILKSANGSVVNAIAYNFLWYQNTEKAQGGWTLERIDPDFFACNIAANWRASEFPAGGTPGFENSIKGLLSDDVSPTLMNVGSEPDMRSFTLNFSKVLQPASISTTSFDLESIGNPDAISFSNANSTITLTFGSQLIPGKAYTLSYTSIEDCFGNAVSGDVTLGTPVNALEGDVLINEILFNPYTGGADFVEIINVSDNILDLSKMEIGEGLEGIDTIFNTDPLSTASTLLLPGEIVCLTSNVDFQQETYNPPANARFLNMRSFPTYDDTRGVVVLQTIIDLTPLVLDRFEYLDDYHFATLVNKNGVSLERLSTQGLSQDPGNWHSAASTVGFATPGYENSQRIQPNEDASEVSLLFNLISPDGDSRDDVLTIQYDLDFIGGNARVSVYDLEGRLVKRIAENSLLGNDSGFFTWDGSTDRGAKASVGAYIVLVEIVDPESKRKVYKLPCAVVGD